MEFINCVQIWNNNDNDKTTKAIHIDIMSTDGKAHCKLSVYPNENVQILSEVYVRPEVRKQGYCNKMLDYLKTKFKIKPFTLVYVDKDAPIYVKDIYNKRNYVILIN